MLQSWSFSVGGCVMLLQFDIPDQSREACYQSAAMIRKVHGHQVHFQSQYYIPEDRYKSCDE